MWTLTNKKTQHVYYLVPHVADHTVGRAKTDLVIEKDDSISRNHAVLQGAGKDVLKLTDTGSRYGTYVNDNIARVVCIRKDQPTELRAGDVVQFGRCGSVWTVGRVNFRCLTSTLPMNDHLKGLLQAIGTELLSTYAAGITHLIMPTITVTTKFLQCLVGQVPVVSPDYFKAVNVSIEQGEALPPVNDFVPACTESYIKNDAQMFHPNPARRDLFKGMEFIFFSSTQCQQFEDIIKLAGGVCLCAQREKVAKTRFVKPNAVTIKFKSSGSSQSQSQSLDLLAAHVTARGLRMIPDVEIGLAILYGSTEKYCNPRYNFAFNVEECAEREPCENEEILAKSSMHSEAVDVHRKVKVELDTIPETEPNTEGSDRGSTSKALKNVVVTTRGTSPRSIPPVSAPVITSPVGAATSVRRSKRFPEATEAKDKEISKENSNPPDTRRAGSSRSLGKEVELSAASSSVSIPPVSASIMAPPVEADLGRRRSKRLPEAGESTEKPRTQATSSDKDSFQEPKRPRRTPGVSPGKSMAMNVANELQRDEEMTEPIESTIPETPSAPLETSSPQPMSSSGFRAVHRQPKEAEAMGTVSDGPRGRARRPANMLLQGDDDDLFNFEAVAPRKKARVDPSLVNASGPNLNSKSGARKPPNEDPDDIFSFEENLPSQRRRAANRRTAGAGSPSRPGAASNSSNSSHTPSVSQQSNAGDSSPSSHYREFIKPVQVSTTGWLSATMCGLKLDPDDGPSSVKIKQEPLDATADCVDGLRSHDKRWLCGMENIIQVQEKSMNLVVHRPPTHGHDDDGHEQSCTLSNGLKNFKGFVKKRNYRVQRTTFQMKIVCVLDESQAI